MKHTELEYFHLKNDPVKFYSHLRLYRSEIYGRQVSVPEDYKGTLKTKILTNTLIFALFRWLSITNSATLG